MIDFKYYVLGPYSSVLVIGINVFQVCIYICVISICQTHRLVSTAVRTQDRSVSFYINLLCLYKYAYSVSTKNSIEIVEMTDVLTAFGPVHIDREYIVLSG